MSDEEIAEEVARSEEGDAQFKDRLSAEDIREAKKIIDILISKGIKVLALDFDKTIVDVHTAGFWRQGTVKLAEHVRPCFEALMRAALPTDLHLCIVTYSMQPNLIRDVLRVVMPRRYLFYLLNMLKVNNLLVLSRLHSRNSN